MSHPIKPTRTPKKPVATGAEAASPPTWPSYTGTSQLVGTSPSGRVTVYVDPSLGAPALTNAQDLLQDADRVVSANDSIFGTTGGPVNVIVFASEGLPMAPEARITWAALTPPATPSKWMLLTAFLRAYPPCSKPN
jgi:hypothetical protein